MADREAKKYYVIGKTGVNVRRVDAEGNEHDEFVCDARDFRTAEMIREALDLREENRDGSDG
jgi:hypothetical protein